MKNKIFTIFIILFFVLGCYCRPRTNLQCKYWKKGMYFLEHAKKFEKENKLYLASYGLNLNGTSETPDWNEIHQFEVTYCFIGKYNIDQARKKLLESINAYLKLINENEDIRPYLYKHPFTYDDLHFRIDFYNEKRGYVGKDFLSSSYLRNGKIYYQIEKEENCPELLYKETYEDALKIVELNK